MLLDKLKIPPLSFGSLHSLLHNNYRILMHNQVLFNVFFIYYMYMCIIPTRGDQYIRETFFITFDTQKPY